MKISKNEKIVPFLAVWRIFFLFGDTIKKTIFQLKTRKKKHFVFFREVLIFFYLSTMLAKILGGGMLGRKKLIQKEDNFFHFSKFSLYNLITFWWVHDDWCVFYLVLTKIFYRWTLRITFKKTFCSRSSARLILDFFEQKVFLRGIRCALGFPNIKYSLHLSSNLYLFFLLLYLNLVSLINKDTFFHFA